MVKFYKPKKDCFWAWMVDPGFTLLDKFKADSDLYIYTANNDRFGIISSGFGVKFEITSGLLFKYFEEIQPTETMEILYA